MTQNKSYTVKDWFANKVAQEVNRSIMICDVFAIIKETDKAVYAVLNLGTDFHKIMWLPKSVLIENEIGEDENPNKGYHHETIFTDSQNEAIDLFKAHWNMYK